MTIKVQLVIEGEKGGPRSGNFGHAGRPGKLGGSVAKPAGGGAADTFTVAGRTLPVMGERTAVIAARQAGEISEDWKSHPGSNLMAYSRKLENGDALEISHGQGAWSAIKYNGKTDKRMHIGDANTPLDAIKLAELNTTALQTQGVPHAKGWSIKFEDGQGYHRLAAGFTDKSIEKTLKLYETRTGKPLPKDSRTDFPSFTVYQNGEEVGGG